MEIYTGAKGWRALQQTGQDVGIVPTNNFNTVLYEGNGSTTQVIADVGFEAGFTWIKDRDVAENHALFDTVRGANEWLHSNDTAAQTTYSGNYGLLSWNNDGFTVGNGTAVNDSGENYVSWNWKAGGNSNTFNIDGVGYATAAAAGMNTGSISLSGCSVNTESGFSIIKFPGNSTSGATIDHGLGKIPDIAFFKNLDQGSASYNWTVYSGPNGPTGLLYLNDTYAFTVTSSRFNDTTPTNQIFTLGNDGTINASGNSTIAYCWTSIPGYSLIGSYTGTGSATDSPKIYTGFEPAWLMTKPTSTTGWWYIFDNKRSTGNPRDKILGANAADAEYQSSNYNVNFYNDGFQYRNNTICCNDAGVEYIFMCFAS